MLKNRIKNLISLIENTEIDEIEVSSFWGGQKIRLSKNSNVNSLNKNLDTTLASKSEKETEEVIIYDSTASSHDKKDSNEPVIETEIEPQPEPDVNLHEVKAPLVGTFYSSPKPTDPPFINIGDKVSKGQVLCIIEAMKIFNDIESDINGTIKEICIENGSPVEFDQLIIKILPE